MSDNAATQTIVGSYKLVEMPDGSMVAMHRLDNGEWVTTKERLTRAEISAEFVKRFAGTDTIPHPHEPQTQGSLEPKSNTDKMLRMVEEAKASKNRLDAYLGEVLGTPELILAGDPMCKENLRKVRARPQELRHVLGLMDILGASDIRWQKVRHHLMHADMT
jgi:hypothetical protein